MERGGFRGVGPAEARGERFALPSRAVALDLCRAAASAEEPGPVLLTGEAGAGKTWLCGQFVAGEPSDRRWLTVDLAPTCDPADLYRAIGLGLGLGPADLGQTRAGLDEFLAEAIDEGRRWALIVDEAQNASAEVLEELRLLSNRLGRPGGFAALLLVGQTRLSRRLATIPMAALEARLAAHIHLRPIDADEARALLARRYPGREWAAVEVDHLHREAGGNPRLLLRQAAPIAARPAPVVAPPPAPTAPRVLEPAPAPRLGAPRPPLRIEEGLIEVGWSGPEPAEADPAPTAAPRALVAVTSGAGDGQDEAIQDHYAALQAWNEWTDNHGRTTSVAAEPPAEIPAPAETAHVWADDQQGFAPYSQLFSRLKQAAEPGA